MYLLDVALTGLHALRLHPLRSFVSVAALVSVLTPYLAGLALARGLEEQAEEAARLGPDLTVTGRQFGRPVPLPLPTVARIQALDGVTRVVPRIVGEIVLGREHIPAVLVGMPQDHFPESASCLRGRLPRGHVAGSGAGNELVIGSQLARRLRLDVGDTIPPFYRNDRGERLSHVVGVFEPTAPIWQADLILTPFDTAAHIFDQADLATDILVWCRPGYQPDVARAIQRDVTSGPPPTEEGNTAEGGKIRATVVTREELLDTLPRGILRREGVFTLHAVFALAVVILVLLVTSGLGQAERRRELAILKATGWQTDEVLLRCAVESLALSLAGACLGLILAWAWLRLLNGSGIAATFLTDQTPADFPVPCRFTPVPVLLAFVLSLVVVLTGTVASAWWTASSPPREVMR